MKLWIVPVALAVGWCWSAASVSAAPPDRPRGEFLDMFHAILGGSQLGPGEGWFKPSRTRYSWEWLRGRFDANGDGRLTVAELGGDRALFAALDRDGDGAVTADDLDWSDSAAYFRQLGVARQFLRRADTNEDGKVSKAEWAALFDRVANGKDNIDPEGVRRLLFPPTPTRKGGPPGGPSKAVLLMGFLTGELGSGAEGPKIDAVAPDFTLKSPDGQTTISLGQFHGKKPVVLIFGSFT